MNSTIKNGDLEKTLEDMEIPIPRKNGKKDGDWDGEWKDTVGKELLEEFSALEEFTRNASTMIYFLNNAEQASEKKTLNYDGVYLFTDKVIVRATRTNEDQLLLRIIPVNTVAFVDFHEFDTQTKESTANLRFEDGSDMPLCAKGRPSANVLKGAIRELFSIN